MRCADEFKIRTVAEGLLANLLDTVVEYNSGDVSSAGKGLRTYGIKLCRYFNITRQAERLHSLFR